MEVQRATFVVQGATALLVPPLAQHAQLMQCQALGVPAHLTAYAILDMWALLGVRVSPVALAHTRLRTGPSHARIVLRGHIQHLWLQPLPQIASTALPGSTRQPPAPRA